MSDAATTRHQQAPAFVHWKPVQSRLVPSNAGSSSTTSNTHHPHRASARGRRLDIGVTAFEAIYTKANASRQQGRILESP